MESTEGSEGFVFSGGNKKSVRTRCQARFIGSGQFSGGASDKHVLRLVHSYIEAWA